MKLKNIGYLTQLLLIQISMLWPLLAHSTKNLSYVPGRLYNSEEGIDKSSLLKKSLSNKNTIMVLGPEVRSEDTLKNHTLRPVNDITSIPLMGKIMELKPLPPKINSINYGAKLPRVMHMLSESKLQDRKQIKILFFGQSIIAPPYVREAIEQDLRARFPEADLVIEHDAIGGFYAQRLVKTAHHMIYHRYPDLVVMHCYSGEYGEFEQIIKDIQTFTTAEILTWTHHVDNISEETDADREFGSQVRREIANQYNFEIAEVREEWKSYLALHNENKSDFLLSDQLHLNSDGGDLLGALLTRYFEDPEADVSTWEDRVKEYPVLSLSEIDEKFQGNWQTDGEGFKTSDSNSKLVYSFEGNRIDIGTMPINDLLGKATILIDGKKPSEHIGTWTISLPSKLQGYNRPGIMKVDLIDLPQKEDTWTLTVKEVSSDGKTFTFDVNSAEFGFQGSGDNNNVFISDNGQISIQPENFSLPHAATLGRLPEAPFNITWEVYNDGFDVWEPEKRTDGNIVDRYTLVKGITNSPHVLEIIPEGDGVIPVKELVVYRPLLGRENVTNLPPVINITAPSKNSEVINGSVLEIQTNASDVDGNVAKVEFFIDGNKIGESNQSPFSFNWEATLGDYTITAVATDNGGLQTTSQPVSISVDNENNQNTFLIEAENAFNVILDTLSQNIDVLAANSSSNNNVVSIFDIGDKISIPFTIEDPQAVAIKIQVRLRAGNQNTDDNYWPDGYEFSLNGDKIILEGINSSISDFTDNLGGSYWGTMESANLKTALEENSLTITSLQNFAAVDYISITLIESNGQDDLLPNVFAGNDIVVNLPVSSVLLNGEASDPDGGNINTSWLQVAGNNGLTIIEINQNSIKIEDLLEGEYIFRYTVIDDEGNEISDEVVVNVKNEDLQPEVNAGPDKEVVINNIDNFQLIGTGNDPDGGTIEFLWVQQSGPNVPTLQGVTTSTLEVSNIVEGTYVFTFSVTDDEGNTSNDEVTVIVSRQDLEPLADAGADIELSLNTTESFTLNGTGSDPDGGEVDYLWTVKSGPNEPSLEGEMSTTLEVSTILEGTYIFTFSVTDDEGNTTNDEVTVTVSKQDLNPLVDAGADLELSLNTAESFTLNGSGSDPDGGEVNYLWTVKSGPNEPSLDGETSATLEVSNIVEGTYVFVLSVTDDEGNTVSDEINVLVTNDAQNSGPSVNINFPTNNSLFEEGIDISVIAEATDLDGTIQGVSFYINDTLHQTLLESPYRFNWTNVTKGTYTIWAEATDDKGSKGVSQKIIVIIEEPLSLDDQAPQLDFVLFPNPINDKFKLEIDYKTKKNVEFKLVTIDGKIKKVFKKELIPNLPIEFDVSTEEKGVYLLLFELDGFINKIKFVKN